MNLQDVIVRLRAQTTTFGSSPNARVAGAAELAEVVGAEHRTGLTLPHAWVIPNSGDVPNVETVVERFTVVCAYDNSTQDRRGQTLMESTDTARTDLIDALVGWEASVNHRPAEFEREELESFDGSTLWYSFEFASVLELFGPRISFNVDFTVAVAIGSSTATVLSDVASEVATVTSGTRLDSDYLEPDALSFIAEGTTKFQVLGAGSGKTDLSTEAQEILPVRIRVHRRQTKGAERTYTEGDMLTHIASLLDRDRWTGKASVFDMVEDPALGFPDDIEVSGG